MRDLTQHLTTRADDNHAPPVSSVRRKPIPSSCTLPLPKDSRSRQPLLVETSTKSGYRSFQILHQFLDQLRRPGVEGHALGPAHQGVQPILLLLRERGLQRGEGQLQLPKALYLPKDLILNAVDTIPPEKLQMMFDKFNRLEQARTSH